jgi:heme exporter protein B
MLKALAHWITTGLPLVVLGPVLAITLNLPPAAYGALVASLLIGTPGLSLIGSVGAALTVGVRRGGLLLSALVLPLYIPTLVFGAQAVARASVGLDAGVPLMMLAAVTLVSAGIGPFATAAALRVNLR